jgi:23S rRNA pseudouridine2605 synthase
MKRLSKVLAAAGVASRRASEELIFRGKVTVNGKVVVVPQTLVSVETDTIAVSGEPIHREQEKVYFVLNKPNGYICSSARVREKKIVIDLFASLPYRLFTVGRLDRDTTGLILVTNDGHFAQEVIHPSKGLTKEYLIKTEEEITADHLRALTGGCLIEGGWVKPAKVVKVRRGTIKISVHEGKKREVRLLVQNSGLTLLSIERIRIGPLLLGNLAIGEFRPLTEHEKRLLLKQET